jgi:hypothetical protein
MELPDDLLYLVRDFARPCTRPDWRTLHRMPSLRFHLDLIDQFNSSFNLALCFFVLHQSSDYIYVLHGGNVQHIVTPMKRIYYFLQN